MEEGSEKVELLDDGERKDGRVVLEDEQYRFPMSVDKAQSLKKKKKGRESLGQRGEGGNPVDRSDEPGGEQRGTKVLDSREFRRRAEEWGGGSGGIVR